MMSHFHWHKKLSKGFTLVELMVVIAIIVIIAGVGFTQLNSASARTAAAARDIIADIQRARLIAINENRNVQFNSVSSTSYQICRVQDVGVPVCDNAITVAGNVNLALSANLTFTPTGTASAGNITVTKTGTSVQYSIVVNNSGKARLVKIN